MRKRRLATEILIGLAITLGAGSAFAGPLTEGTVLSNYTVVSVGPHASVMINSGPITGNVLLGDGTTATSAGGGNGRITGHVDDSGTVLGDNLANLQFPPTTNTVSAAIGTQAFNDAGALSSAAAALTATQTFANINGTQTITGNGGLNVIDVGSLQNPMLTIKGTSADTFIFNVSGLFNTNQAITLNGVTASQILWNFTGTGTVFQTSGGDVLDGTFLATQTGADFQFSALNLTGQLIDTGGHMQIVSNSTIAADVPFVSPFSSPTPEPATLTSLGTALLELGLIRRWRRKV